MGNVPLQRWLFPGSNEKPGETSARFLSAQLELIQLRSLLRVGAKYTDRRPHRQHSRQLRVIGGTPEMSSAIALLTELWLMEAYSLPTVLNTKLPKEMRHALVLCGGREVGMHCLAVIPEFCTPVLQNSSEF